MQRRQLLYFLFINVLVSAVTTTIVLLLWDRSHRPETPERDESAPMFVLPAPTETVPAATPEVRLQPYQVAAGETLGEIALAFDTSLEDLLALNGLTDPNAIGAGTTIFVPMPTTEVPGAEEPEPGASSSANEGQVEIVGIFGAGDLSSERVQLRGLGEGTQSLTGWRLRDEDGNEYIFPQITLFGNGAVDVYSSAGVDTVVSLYWRSASSIWENGETATLFDGSGNIQATYTLP